MKKGVLKNFSKFTGKTPVPESLFQVHSFIKKDTLARVFSFEYWEILMDTFFIEHPRTTAFVNESLILLNVMFIHI